MELKLKIAYNSNKMMWKVNFVENGETRGISEFTDLERAILRGLEFFEYTKNPQIDVKYYCNRDINSQMRLILPQAKKGGK
jgi:hypothetical protein